MDNHFLIYEKRQELWHLLQINWKSDFITVKYWAMISVIVVFYMVWYKFTDKKRLVDLLLFGSLFTVMRMIMDLAGVTAGYWMYKIRVLPLSPSLFLQDLTIVPLTYMLVQQYSPNWRKYFIWNAVGSGFISAVIMPLLSAFGYLQLMRWNYLYSFIVLYILAVLSRLSFNLVIQVQHKAREGESSPLESIMLQPALKLLPNQENEDE